MAVIECRSAFYIQTYYEFNNATDFTLHEGYLYNKVETTIISILRVLF